MDQIVRPSFCRFALHSSSNTISRPIILFAKYECWNVIAVWGWVWVRIWAAIAAMLRWTESPVSVRVLASVLIWVVMAQWTESPVSVRVFASVRIWVAMARWTESPVSVIVLWMLASVRIWAAMARPPGVQSYKCQSDSSLFLQQRGIMRWEIVYLDNLSITSPSIYRYLHILDIYKYLQCTTWQLLCRVNRC